MSEIISIKEFIDGDNLESGLLYKNYVQALYSYGLSLGFSGDICMDAIHDVFYKLYYLKNERISEIKNVKYYLFSSLKNRLFDIYRKNSKTESINSESIPFNIEVSVLDSMIEEEDKNLIIKKVESLMNTLTDRQKEVIYLRYIQEMDYDEIATLMNMTPKSARMLVFRSIDKLRNLSASEKKIFFLFLFIFFLSRNF